MYPYNAPYSLYCPSVRYWDGWGSDHAKNLFYKVCRLKRQRCLDAQCPIDRVDRLGDEESYGCHPASTLLIDANGNPVAIDTVNVGDVITTPHGLEPVVAFLHSDPLSSLIYISITDDANNTLLISDLHYLETDGILQQASNVKVGHSWQTVTGTQHVVAVSQVYEHGVYHLLTPSLTYYADGIAASCLLNFAPHANHSTELFDDVSSLALLFDLMSELAMHCMRNGKHLNSDMYQALLGDDPFTVYAGIMQSCAPGVPTNATVSDVPMDVTTGSLAIGSSWATSLHDVAVKWVQLRHPASKGANWLHSPSPVS
jgi:hypothetical protein